jgi:hypothetical protein
MLIKEKKTGKIITNQEHWINLEEFEIVRKVNII